MVNKKNKKFANLITLFCVVVTALTQSLVIQTFLQPAGLLSSGFTGVALLIEKIGFEFFNIDISVSFVLIALNIPVALLCSKAISRRFVMFSVIEVLLNSTFLKYLYFSPLFETDDRILNVVFGGVIYGMSIVLALKAGASTGGTDFIALYISNKKGRSIWTEVFIFNVILLCVFGALFGWSDAGYSIIFQFITTKTISTFHQRYLRLTLQITTSKPDEVIEAYISNFRHGLSCAKAFGGYSKKEVTVIHTVVSSYEVPEIVELLQTTDPCVIINSFKTEEFYGGFYQAPLE